MPVNVVSFYDSRRFANWLDNGQPTGAQDSTTTEDGAYDMSFGSSVVRSVDVGSPGRRGPECRVRASREQTPHAQ